MESIRLFIDAWIGIGVIIVFLGAGLIVIGLLMLAFLFIHDGIHWLRFGRAFCGDESYGEECKCKRV